MKRVFVVEDEAVVALEIQDHLRGLGYEVCGHAARGDAALRQIPEARPDLVLMDINLGEGLSGMDVAERLRSVIDVPVILLTAYSDVGLTQRAGRSRSFAYISKPFEPRVLGANIELALVRHDATVALRESEARFRRMVDHISDALIVDDVEGRVVFANDRFLDLFRISREELPHVPLEGYVAPAWRALLRNRHDRRVAGQQVSADFQYEGLRRDGSVFWIEVNTVPVRDAHGTIVGTQSALRDITERTRAAAALTESEQRYRRIFTEALEGIFNVEIDGTIIEVNPAFAQMLGYGSPAELIGTNLGHLYNDPGARRRIQENYGGSDTIAGVEAVWLKKNGELLNVELYGNTVRGKGGERIGYHGIVRDVTSQRQHDAALRILSTGLSRLSGPAFFEAVAAQLAEISGAEIGFVGTLRPSPVPTIRTLSFVVDGKATPPMEYALAGTPCEAVISGRTSVILEDVQRLFPGDNYLVTLGAEGYAAAPLLDASGQVIGHVGIITRKPFVHPERKESIVKLFALRTAAELERQRAEARFVGVFDFAPDALLIVDDAGCIVLANRVAEQTFGYSREELLRLKVEDLVPQAQRHGHVKLRAGFRAQENPRRMGSERSRLSALRKDGTPVPVEISLSPMHAEQGGLVVAAVRDITQRLALEQQANRRQRLDAIGTLAGGIAHDLNNALGPIMMAADILRTHYPEVPDIVDTIEQSANRAAGMVRQLLTFAKGAEGERVAVRMGHLIGEMEKIITSTFPKDIHLQVRLGRNVPSVRGDATQLHQVLLNLCVNARDAMPNGGQLWLDLRAETVDAPTAIRMRAADTKAGAYVVLRVRDTGNGIPPAVLDKIFDPFFTTKGPDKGTGLGLSTVLGIVKGHGGFLRVESELSRGSVFSVYLPAEPTDVEAPAAPPERAAFAGRGETVLYVDDEAALRDVAAQVLRQLNFTPLTAVDGTDGLLQAAQRGPEIRAIITDLIMPHMDGIAFVRAARRMLPTVPIIVASGRIEDEAEVELQALRVDGLLNKPFTQLELAEALRAALSSGGLPE